MDEFSKNQMLQIIIEHIKFLCGILKTPSYDIVLGEFLLSLYMKMFYDDYHRRCTNNFILKGNQLEKTLTFTKNRIREKLQVLGYNLSFLCICYYVFSQTNFYACFPSITWKIISFYLINLLVYLSLCEFQCSIYVYLMTYSNFLLNK